MTNFQSKLNTGAVLMVLGALGFVIYGIAFGFLNFYGTSFELGVSTLDGLSKADFHNLYPGVAAYMSHINVAIAGFLVATGVAVAALSWYGARRGQLWALIAAVIAPVLGLAAALPMHYLNHFEVDRTLHLGPIYLATGIFVVGAIFVLKGTMAKAS